MVLPLYDHSPFKWPTPPYVTWALIAANVVVFLLQSALTVEQNAVLATLAGLTPAGFTDRDFPEPALWALLTLITHAFLHANFWHVAGNMIFLWVFGDDVEEALGHARFLLFYLICAAGSGAVYVASDPGSRLSLIGASGAVAGVVAAYLLFRPCEKVTVLVFVVPVRIRSFWVIGGWAIWQVLEVASRQHDGVAYWAHVGGLAIGALCFVLMRPPGVPLFECAQVQPVLAEGEGAGPPRTPR